MARPVRRRYDLYLDDEVMARLQDAVPNRGVSRKVNALLREWLDKHHPLPSSSSKHTSEAIKS